MTDVALETRMRRVERSNRGLWVVLALLVEGSLTFFSEEGDVQARFPAADGG